MVCWNSVTHICWRMQVSSTIWHLVSFSSIVCLLTQTGSPLTAVNLLAKVNGHQTCWTLTLLIIKCQELCLNTTRHFIPSQRTLMDWSLAVNMKPAAIVFSQQGHTELHKKTELVWKLGWVGINCLMTLNIEH